MTLRNDVVFTLLTLAQLVVDIAGELNARRGERFETYREAIHTLASDPAFPTQILDRLERVAVQALEELEPIAEFGKIIQKVESA